MTGDAALQVFERCRNSMTIMLFKLTKQINFYVHIDELINEAQKKWVECFPEKYENDKQFMKYMFIVMKNRIRDLKKDKMRYEINHISDPSKISICSDEGDLGHVRVWNEMAVDKKEELPPIRVEISETISKIEEKLVKKFHKDVFACLIEGFPPKKIAETLGCSVGHVAKTKHDYIWPVVKDVMEIADDKYAVLIDSGRVYS